MSDFWDGYEDGSGLSFVGKEEKEALIADEVAIPVLKVTRGVGQFGPRFIVVTQIDGEDRALTFAAGSVESRDRLLEAMTEYLDSEGAETPYVVIERKGRSVLLRAPDSEDES